MLKDISSIRIQGASFNTPTSLLLFNPRDGEGSNKNDKLKTVKGTILYGRNGTGKSTIAKAFRKLKGEDIPAIHSVLCCDKDSQLINLSEDEKNRIFVFDEDYVNNQVKLKENHLDTIVMLGEAANLADKIEMAQKELENAEAVFKIKQDYFNEYNDIHNPKSPKYCLRKICNALRGDDCWAGRDRVINDRRSNTQVKDDTYKKFINIKPEMTRSELIVAYDEQLKELKQAKQGSEKIDLKVPSLSDIYSKYDDWIVKLLAKKLEKPELSEREQYLLSLVEEGNATNLLKQAIYFKQSHVKNCPYCLQPVTEQYKLNLVNSIEKVLSKTVSDHQEELSSHIYQLIDIDLNPYKVLVSYQKCIDLIETINAEINRNNELINRKIDNPYETIVINDFNITSSIALLIDNLKNLEKERLEFNQKVTDTKPIIIRLNEINSSIAHYEIKDFVKEYDKQLDEFQSAEKDYNEAKIKLDNSKEVVEDLDAQRKNVRYAIDIINKCMSYIFFDENRLKIDYVDGEYRLYSKGKSVSPSDVSVGERNIIGLSYFFTSIMEGQEKKKVYTKEYLLVIDDPISSYDIENRIGTLSFLKHKLSLFLEGNKNTKTLITTHDLKTVFDLQKIFDEIVNNCKKIANSKSIKFSTLEIRNGEISQFIGKRQEYTEILKCIYNYGLGEADEQDLMIGNMIRQALEAFSTFEYKKGISDVSTDKSILSLLPGLEFEAYFKNLMYRLVLHGESHKLERIQTMEDFDFFGVISNTEKKRTAKDVLCFIYLLNQQHVLEHLQEIRDVKLTLDNWCNEIKNKSVVP